MMYSLLLLSSLAVLAPVLAAPGVQNSLPTATPAPAPVPTIPKTNTVSYPTPTPTVLSLPPKIQELKRRIPAASLGKRSCAYGTFACADGSGCCNTGEICYGAGYCYDP